MELAVHFVARESAGLAAALRAPHDRAAVDNVVSWHDDAHGTWLGLLAACQRAGWPSAQRIDRLYTYHGRLIELLERGVLLGHGSGAVLADRLSRLTTAAIDALRADATSHAPTPCRHRPAAPTAQPPSAHA